MTVSTENFVKTIYQQNNLSGADTRMSTIAGLLNISKAAATDMARKLAAKNLVHYIRYKPIALTEKGNKLALKVLRKHRLWELFLYRTLNLSLHEIHREAEVLEHLTSDFLMDKIDNYLDNPSIDPHGDPIPANNGKVKDDQAQITLSKARSGKSYQICRLSGSEKDFFEFCTANQISIGADIWIEKQYDSNKMTEIKVNQNKIILTEVFASVIYVKHSKR
jgi:DtxR family Mn-dependent transcriptional regulator